MRVRMLSILAGPGQLAQPGQEIDVPEAQGRGLIEGGYAVPVQPPAAVAVAPADEKKGEKKKGEKKEA